MPPKFKFTRTEIIAAGFDIVRSNGWSALSTRAIAKKLGSSARPIYSFFAAMTQLEEEIVKKAVALLYQCMIQKRTDDPWIDHGVGYVLFAFNDQYLFRCINDEKHIEFYRKYGDVIWEDVTAALSGYVPFSGLTKEQIDEIQVTRWLFAHGLAFQASNPPAGIWSEETLITTLQQGSLAIYNGLKLKFDSAKST